MKTFTRRELVHTAIEQIRMRLKMYEETEDLEYISYAIRMARTMGDLKIIEFEKQRFLYEIIDNEFKRLLEKESPAPNDIQVNPKTGLIIAQAV